ncbi:MAG TPA: carbon storage regulator [Polyangiaceae bacterium]|nr:carbon storage regulator [Polyangiaceae bacterium]
MLMVSRRVGERIVVGDGIEIIVTEIHRSTVKLAVKAPRGHAVMRGEVWDAVARENRAAAEATLEQETDALVADPSTAEPTP